MNIHVPGWAISLLIFIAGYLLGYFHKWLNYETNN
jgi:hypothetical protein